MAKGTSRKDGMMMSRTMTNSVNEKLQAIAADKSGKPIKQFVRPLEQEAEKC